MSTTENKILFVTILVSNGTEMVFDGHISLGHLNQSFNFPGEGCFIT